MNEEEIRVLAHDMLSENVLNNITLWGERLGIIITPKTQECGTIKWK